MARSSNRTHKADDLDLTWDKTAQRHDEALRAASYNPSIPRDLDDYLRFLADVAPEDSSLGRRTTPVDKQFTLPGLIED